MPDHAVCSLRSHRPSAADGEAGADHCVEEGLPAGACCAFVAIALGLLEGVVDGDRKGRVRLLGEAVHRLRHAVEEERLRLLLAAVAVGRGDQFLGLGHGERGEEVGEDWSAASDAARRRRSPTGRRSRCCRSRADRWRRLCPSQIAGLQHPLDCAARAAPAAASQTPCALHSTRFRKSPADVAKWICLRDSPRPSGVLAGQRLRRARLRVSLPSAERDVVVSRHLLDSECQDTPPPPRRRRWRRCRRRARGLPSSGRPAASASRFTRSRASCTRSEKVVSATSWRGVKRSPHVVMP